MREVHQDLMMMALWISEQATCNRLHVGAIVVDKNFTVIGTGVNDSLPGTPTCKDDGCRMYNGSCVRTIHAEVNAINNARSKGFDVKGLALYCTDQPCADCLKYMTLCGISKVYYKRPYRHKYDVDTNIELIQSDGWEKVDTLIKN